jgi:hypothetical protein
MLFRFVATALIGYMPAGFWSLARHLPEACARHLRIGDLLREYHRVLTRGYVQYLGKDIFEALRWSKDVSREYRQCKVYGIALERLIKCLRE